MLFRDEAFRHRNFKGLGFRLIILIEKKLLSSFGKNKIAVLESQLYQAFKSHPEFIEEGMVVGIRLLPKKDFPYGGQFRYWKHPKLKKCYLNLNANYYFKDPKGFYPMLIHELTHWHDRVIASRWHNSHLVSEKEEENLLSMILHSLRIDGLANLRMFYAKLGDNLFDEDAHKITKIAREKDVNLDYISYVNKFKAELLTVKKKLLKSKKPKEDILAWVSSNYTNFYFLGGMMCYFILFMHMIKNKQNIQIFLDKKGKNKINISKIKHYLHRQQLYFGKVPLKTFEYTFNKIKKLGPAKFFILYLEACKVLGISNLIFDKAEIDIVIKHKHEIDKDIIYL
ncbi:hypothetical protein GOV06_05125 [Candidatus Woesearchaeota archaeon]|nr:hypothetical protein [Candidatus Woesearchaeota archaeon]